jgi:hypothetical protein
VDWAYLLLYILDGVMSCKGEPPDDRGAPGILFSELRLPGRAKADRTDCALAAVESADDTPPTGESEPELGEKPMGMCSDLGVDIINYRAGLMRQIDCRENDDWK